LVTRVYDDPYIKLFNTSSEGRLMTYCHS